MTKDNPEMTAQDVIEFILLLAENQIEVTIDGGWGVDALLGEQTRLHEDLDIAIAHKDASRLRALLEARGYSEVVRDDSWECNFVMGDENGHLIDIHSCTFDAEGNNIFGVAYPFDSLNGSGTIHGQAVRCIPAEWMVKFHTGYRLDENDYHDVKALCQRFNIQLPGEYDGFEKTSPETL